MKNNYPSRTRRTCTIAEAKSKYAANTETNAATWVAGRIVGIIDDGFVLQDESDRLDILSPSSVNVGDIMEVKINHRYDEQNVSVFDAAGMQVLAPCKADFFISQRDPNFLRFIIDRHFKEKVDQRGKILQKIREYFYKKGFLEVDTPLLVNLPGMEPYLDVFKTQFFENHQAEIKHDMYLITSPEYALKKLLTAGYEKIFQLNKSFRNKETSSTLHNPEFTMLEWYRAYASYEEIMNDTENLINHLTIQMHKRPVLNYQGQMIDTTPPWTRLKVKDAFKQYADISEEQFDDHEQMRKIAQQKGYNVNEQTPYDDVFFYIFMNEIEPKLGLEKPVILYDYPLSMAALSKTCSDNPKYAERFEVYIAGIELCNAFTELNDPEEQKKRLEQERKQRQAMGKDDYPEDQNFIKALEFGMPPSSGNALGVDRLIMLLTNTPDIRDTLYFPYRDL